MQSTFLLFRMGESFQSVHCWSAPETISEIDVNPIGGGTKYYVRTPETISEIYANPIGGGGTTYDVTMSIFNGNYE